MNSFPLGPSLFLASDARRTRIRSALTMLRDARDGASDLGLCPAEFAIEVGQLHAAGLGNTDLRWLIGKGFVEQVQELLRPQSASRSFRRSASLAITDSSCFLLTDAGLRFLSEWPDSPTTAPLPGARANRPEAAAPDPLPRWDGKRRELVWNGALVKRFRVSAANQETILSAFQEEGWPTHIDDPLPQSGGLDPKVRLHDAIKGLNRHQQRRLLCFLGDGTGRGILWIPRAAVALPPGRT
jgi:hypothetical protein